MSKSVVRPTASELIVVTGPASAQPKTSMSLRAKTSCAQKIKKGLNTSKWDFPGFKQWRPQSLKKK